MGREPVTATPGWSLREAIARRGPPAPSAPVTRLRVLIAVTAAAVVVIEILSFVAPGDSGFGMGVRTVWTLLRVVGFLALLRSVRYGRAVSRPFGLVLATTTVFAVARLAVPPAGGLMPRVEVLVGLGILTLLCATIVVLLYRSPGMAAHLARRPARRHVPPSVLTARVAALSIGPLVLVPLLVGVGLLFDDHRPLALARLVLLLGVWGALFLALAVVMPVSSVFLLLGKGWARGLVGAASVVVLVVHPLLCYAVLGLDGLLRDGAPLVVTAVVGLVALRRSPAGTGGRGGASEPV